MTDAEVRKLNAKALWHVKRGRDIPPKLLARMNVCNACEQPKREWYMMRNDVWQKVNPARHGHLCLSCLEKRLGRALRRSDFADGEVLDEGGNAISLR
jgi:hypothetical protein